MPSAAEWEAAPRTFVAPQCQWITDIAVQFTPSSRRLSQTLRRVGGGPNSEYERSILE
jgi:hypothetical protein